MYASWFFAVLTVRSAAADPSATSNVTVPSKVSAAPEMTEPPVDAPTVTNTTHRPGSPGPPGSEIPIATPRIGATVIPQAMVTLLQTMQADRQKQDADSRADLLGQLARDLRDLIPGQVVVVFGSLARPVGFNRDSDVDIALEEEPSGMSAHALASMLEERLGRRVDVVLLGECRFAEKIRKEGMQWIA